MKRAHHESRHAMMADSASASSRPRVRAGSVMSTAPAVPKGVPEPQALRPMQLALLAAAVFVVSAGYGGLMPMLPAWLAQQMPQADAAEVARHVGFLPRRLCIGGFIKDGYGLPMTFHPGQRGTRAIAAGTRWIHMNIYLFNGHARTTGLFGSTPCSHALGVPASWRANAAVTIAAVSALGRAAACLK